MEENFFKKRTLHNYQKKLSKALTLESITLDSQLQSLFYLLISGTLYPLKSFMNREDYFSVLKEMKLSSGEIFPVPIILPISEKEALKFKPSHEILLKDDYNLPLAILQIEDIFERNLALEYQKLYAKKTPTPINYLINEEKKYAIAGSLEIIQLPQGYKIIDTFKSPEETKGILNTDLIFAYIADELPLRPYIEEIRKIISREKGGLLFLVKHFPTDDEIIGNYFKLKAYEMVSQNLFKGKSEVVSIPYPKIPETIRDLLFKTIIAKNYGATRILLIENEDYYKVYSKYESNLDIKFITINKIFYNPKTKKLYKNINIAKKQSSSYYVLNESFLIERYLHKGQNIPSIIMYPDINKILMEYYSDKTQRGFCIWLTGLPCSGKSTIAQLLKLSLEAQGKRVTLFDGDFVRNYISEGLTFSQEDRKKNMLKVAYIAREIVKHKGIVICSLVSPYKSVREKIRILFPKDSFIEVYLDCPLEICEKRDLKGLYQMAKKGLVKNFTGIDDPYEPPDNPEIRLKTNEETPEESIKKIILFLKKKKFIL